MINQKDGITTEDSATYTQLLDCIGVKPAVAGQSRGKSPGVCSADAAGGHPHRSHMAAVAFHPSAFAEERSLEFQVVSSPLGFKVRLYPKQDGLVKAQRFKLSRMSVAWDVPSQAEDKMGASEANAAVGGCNDGHGRTGKEEPASLSLLCPARNFRIELPQALASVLNALRQLCPDASLGSYTQAGDRVCVLVRLALGSQGLRRSKVV